MLTVVDRGRRGDESPARSPVLTDYIGTAEIYELGREVLKELRENRVSDDEIKRWLGDPNACLGKGVRPILYITLNHEPEKVRAAAQVFIQSCRY